MQLIELAVPAKKVARSSYSGKPLSADEIHKQKFKELISSKDSSPSSASPSSAPSSPPTPTGKVPPSSTSSSSSTTSPNSPSPPESPPSFEFEPIPADVSTKFCYFSFHLTSRI